MKFVIWLYFGNLSIKFNFNLNLTRITAIYVKTEIKFWSTSRSVLLRTKNMSDKICRETRKTHFVFNNCFNRTVYDIMWKNIVEWGSPQMTIWCMHVACWMPKATNTRAVCVSILYVHCLLFLTDNVLTLSPLRSDYWLRYVCLSVCPHVSGRRPEVLCFLNLSPHIALCACLAPCCGHVASRSSCISWCLLPPISYEPRNLWVETRRNGPPNISNTLQMKWIWNSLSVCATLILRSHLTSLYWYLRNKIYVIFSKKNPTGCNSMPSDLF